VLGNLHLIEQLRTVILPHLETLHVKGQFVTLKPLLFLFGHAADHKLALVLEDITVGRVEPTSTEEPVAEYWVDIIEQARTSLPAYMARDQIPFKSQLTSLASRSIQWRMSHFGNRSLPEASCNSSGALHTPYVRRQNCVRCYASMSLEDRRRKRNRPWLTCRSTMHGCPSEGLLRYGDGALLFDPLGRMMIRGMLLYQPYALD
jgi:hypothetical protein